MAGDSISRTSTATLTPLNSPPDSSEPILLELATKEGKALEGLSPEDPFYPEKSAFLKSYFRDLEHSLKERSFSWSQPSSYSAAFSAGYGARGFQNGGWDHGSPSFRLLAGVNIPLNLLGDQLLTLRFFFEHSAAKSGASGADAETLGLEGGYLAEILPGWLYLGGSFGLGPVFYSTPGKQGGLVYNGNSELRELNSTGVHFELGPKLCTAKRIVCLTPKYRLDLGMGQGTEGVNSTGLQLDLELDPLRIWDPESPVEVVDRYRQESLQLGTEIWNRVRLTDSETLVYDFAKTLPDKALAPFSPDPAWRQQNFPFEKDALASLLKNNPQVLAFGEMHPARHYPGMSTAKLFAYRLLPLVAPDYPYLVTEYLPADFSEEEWKYFRKTGGTDPFHTPQLLQVLELLRDRAEDLNALLLACRRYGVQAVGGGPELIDWKRSQAGTISHQALMLLIDENTREAIERLAGKGKRVLAYHGMSHNSIYPGVFEFDSSYPNFGKELARQFPYWEVDLVLPELATYDFLSKEPDKREVALFAYLKHWIPFVPEKGSINLVERGPHAYAMVYPFQPVKP